MLLEHTLAYINTCTLTVRSTKLGSLGVSAINDGLAQVYRAGGRRGAVCDSDVFKRVLTHSESDVSRVAFFPLRGALPAFVDCLLGCNLGGDRRGSTSR